MSNISVKKVSILNKVRSIIGRLMQYAELPIRLAVKFFAFLFLFRIVSGAEMFASIEQTGLLQSQTVQMVLALAATLLPNRCGVFVAFALITYNVFQVSLLGAILVGIVLMLFYVIASSLFPDQVYLIVLVPICIHFQWYLALPLVAGMYMGVIAVVPTVIGVMVYRFWGIIPLFMNLQMDGSLDGIPKLITEASQNGLNAFMSNNDSLIYLMVVFTAVIVVTALVRMLHVNFSRYIALGAGSIFGLVALMYGASRGSLSGVNIAWNSVIIIAALLFLELLKVPLSYKSAQILEFEDDQYVYKVRMIPKMSDRAESIGKPVITSVAERKQQSQERENLRRKMIREQGLPVDEEAPAASSAPYDYTIYPESKAADNSGNGVDLTLAPGEVTNYSGDLSGYGINNPNYEAPSQAATVVGGFEGVAGETQVAETVVAETLVAGAQAVSAYNPMENSMNIKRSPLADDSEEPMDLFSDYDQNHQ